MAAIVQNTGPVLIYVGLFPAPAPAFGSAPPPITAAFLGTGKVGPDLSVDAGFEDVMNDLGGSKHPIDRLYQGEEAETDVTFTRFDETVLRRLEGLPRMGTRGSNLLGELGTVMGQEGFLFPLWLVFASGGKPVMAANGMPLGYRFPGTLLAGPRRRATGTRANEWTVPFKHQRVFTPGNPASTGSSFLLYDHNTSAVSSVLIT